MLRDKEFGNRSRFISDETMFGNINDIPDKSFEKATDDLEEESKDQGRTIAPRTLQPPVELLGIPLECVMADYRDRVKLSPFA